MEDGNSTSGKNASGKLATARTAALWVTLCILTPTPEVYWDLEWHGGRAEVQRNPQAGLVRLSDREAQALYLLASEAMQSKQIAHRLGVSDSRIRGIIDRTLQGLALDGRGQLVLWLLQRPQCFLGDWVDAKMHALGCVCAFCSIIRHRPRRAA